MRCAYSGNLGTVRVRSNGETDTNWPFDAAALIQNGVSQIHFTGKLSDTEDTLDYFAARYYEPNWGRFTTPDWSPTPEAVPYANLGNPQSLNLYSYVLNNPVTVTDPDGHKCCVEWLKKAWGAIAHSTQGQDQAPDSGLPPWGLNPRMGAAGGLTLAGAGAGGLGEASVELGAAALGGSELGPGDVLVVAGAAAYILYREHATEVEAAEVVGRAETATGNESITVGSRAAAESAAAAFLGDGSRPITQKYGNRAGSVIGAQSADGQRVVRDDGGHFNFENKATGGNLHVTIGGN